MSSCLEECYKINLFDIYRGDDAAYKGCIVDKDKNPMNISGWTFRTTLKLSYKQSDEQAAVNIVTGPLFDISAKTGEFYVWFPNELTSTLTGSRYFIDIRLENNGVKTTIIRGRVGLIGKIQWKEGTHV